MMRITFFVAVCISASSVVNSFCPSVSSIGNRQTMTFLAAAASKTKTKPTFNKSADKWEKSPGDDGAYPYDAVGALLRHGPSPFLTRVTNAEEYEQYVLNYMAEIGVDRREATGNIDAKINNAADWAYQKMEENKGKPKVDYTVLNAKDAALAAIWAVFIIPLTVSVITQTFSQLDDGVTAYSTYRGY